MNIRWPKKAINEKLYKVAQVKPWRQTIKVRQIKRLPNNTPVKTAIKYLNEETKKPRS